MEFENAKIVPEWWTLHDDGTFHCYDDLHEARHDPGAPFTICDIAPTSIAVFVDGAVAPAARTAMSSNRPDWLDSIVLATVVADGDAAIAVIDADIAVRRDAALETCAFAVACAAFAEG
ncbi:MAG TPA: hypothetical protein VK601_20080, partial [Kofleriaceae bacterium]|nr:hypothetical protein [Kofleriaceae bacterium]